MENIANRLKSLRKEKKITMKQVSKETGVKISTISNYENGYSIPKTDSLKKLARFYNVSESYIMGYSENKQSALDQQTSKLNKYEIELNEKNKELEESLLFYKNLKTEYNRFENSLDEIDKPFLTQISKYYGNDISNNSDRSKLIELYENNLEELSKNNLLLANERDYLMDEILRTEKILRQLTNGEIFSIDDRINPEFKQNGKSQIEISEYLKTLPFILDYKSTMKIEEYAKMLFEKKENRFNPNSSKNN